MFKELVLWMHRMAHDFCLARPVTPPPRHVSFVFKNPKKNVLVLQSFL